VITSKLGEPTKFENSEPDKYYDINAPIDLDETLVYDSWEPDSSMPEADEWKPEAFDQYISAQVILPSQDSQLLGTVIARKKTSMVIPLELRTRIPSLIQGYMK